MRLYTIGVYGRSEADFRRDLHLNNINLLVDVRARRGVRLKGYSFANSRKLQILLRELEIGYIHLKELAPAKTLRDWQKSFDRKYKVKKSERTSLSDEFKLKYRESVLNNNPMEKVGEAMGIQTDKDSISVCLLCVESNPEACHRSILADLIKDYFHCEVVNL